MKRLLFFISIISVSCTNNDVTSSLLLKGTWVEIVGETDTLIFDNHISPDVFLLRREKEMWNGQLLPKRGSGMYKFKLKEDEISIYNMISSCVCFNDYYFKTQSNQITIGNFYDPSSQGDLEVFKKIE